MERYEAKRAVIIGGTSGIGLATATMLLDGGARVLVTARGFSWCDGELASQLRFAWGHAHRPRVDEGPVTARASRGASIAGRRYQRKSTFDSGGQDAVRQRRIRDSAGELKSGDKHGVDADRTIPREVSAHPVNGTLGSFRINVCDHEPCATCQKLAPGRRADTSVAAGDQNDLAIQVVCRAAHLMPRFGRRDTRPLRRIMAIEVASAPRSRSGSRPRARRCIWSTFQPRLGSAVALASARDTPTANSISLGRHGAVTSGRCSMVPPLFAPFLGRPLACAR
jgi:hypothetical protein